MPTDLQVLTSTTGTKTDCWNTPQHVVDDVLRFFNYNLALDPCSNSQSSPNVIANKLYTREDDGLNKDWNEPTVFMNHPYSQSKLWIPHAVRQQEKYGNEMLLLIKLDVSTKWWRHVANKPWLAYNRRLRFGNAPSAAPFQSAMIYLGEDLDYFITVFSKDGYIYNTIT